MTAIAPHMTFYLRDYLAKQKDASPYTSPFKVVTL